MVVAWAGVLAEVGVEGKKRIVDSLIAGGLRENTNERSEVNEDIDLR